MTDTAQAFPFTLSDVAFWVCRMKNGSLVKYVIDRPAQVGAKLAPICANITTYPSSWTGGTYNTGVYSKVWCDHVPDVEKPVFRAENLELFMANAAGGRKTYDQYDLAIDCGKVITPGYVPASRISGRLDYAKALRPYETISPPTRLTNNVLWLDWVDREAPPVDPEFWGELAAMIRSQKKNPYRVLCICEGGHGRSGTSAVNLMLHFEPTYSALDAITHLRAVHCARSIESVMQHKYINTVAASLKRPQDALDAEEVQDFRARFMDMTAPAAKEVQGRIK